MARKTSKPTGKKRYITKQRLSSRDGSEVWQPGAEIWLDDLVAQRHLAKGTVEPADETEAPAPAEPKTVTHKGVNDGDANSTDA